jgi:hypothetical protein
VELKTSCVTPVDLPDAGPGVLVAVPRNRFSQSLVPPPPPVTTRFDEAMQELLAAVSGLKSFVWMELSWSPVGLKSFGLSLEVPARPCSSYRFTHRADGTSAGEGYVAVADHEPYGVPSASTFAQRSVSSPE